MALVKIDCPHCGIAHVAANIAWQEGNPSGKLFLARCGACHLPISGRAVNTAGYDTDFVKSVGDITHDYWQIRQTWPEIVSLSAPEHTPASVAKRFIEGEEAYQRGNWNAAVAMYRSALDIATKGMDGVPPRLTFYQRLQWLHEEHRITPEMRAWADHVRIDGNEALHEPDEFTEADAKPLRLFTETFLKYAFELPGEVSRYREQTEPPPPE
ncbi:DUF4145 domain-containing protein [Brevundimonas sp.]|uniref:DUF4145 domain-containing protein n=1 Tax=Brevundimonas sp. TaxID=1871086 RepID=UPI003F712C27